LNRAIQKYLEDPLAEFILNNQAKLTVGTTMSATLDEHQNMIITIVDTDNKKTKKGKA
jgi:ATP-dependent Clp protease ATP-binding subunit ClpC